MRAVVVKEFGPIDSHTVEEVPDPEAGPGEVLIDTHAIGVNFPDTLMVQGLYQAKPDRPFSPGRDAAGEVAAVGSGVTRFKPGDRVATQVRWGAYAERVVAPADRTFLIPDGVSYESAAAFGTVYPTAHVSLMQCARYRTGETVLVLGAAGGIGLAAVHIAKAKRATVIAGDISEEKCQLALDNGADHAIDLAVDDLREKLREQVFAVTNDRGVDVIIDPIGGDVFDAAMRALAFDGRIVSVGYVSGRIPEVRLNYLNVKNLTVAGVSLDQFYRNRPEIAVAAVEDVFDMHLKGQFAPEITGTYPLDEFKTVMNLFAERKTKGKVLMTTGRSG